MSPTTNKFEDIGYGIKIFHEILFDEERIKLLHQFKPYLKYSPERPGLQTDSNMHLLCESNSSFFNPFNKIKKRVGIKNKINKSWVNYNDEKTSEVFWHSHSHKTCVYMLENPEEIGTYFLINDIIFKSRCPTNSLIFFPKKIVHCPPTNLKKSRYTLVIDFEEITYT